MGPSVLLQFLLISSRGHQRIGKGGFQCLDAFVSEHHPQSYVTTQGNNAETQENGTFRNRRLVDFTPVCLPSTKLRRIIHR